MAGWLDGWMNGIVMEPASMLPRLPAGQQW
jgi:hypothetical protein